MKNIELLCDSHHGVYLPSVWCSNTENIWGIKQEDWDYLLDASNLEDEYYWDVWNDVLSYASYIDDNGVAWTLYQDEDLWAIAYDELSIDEKEELGL